MTQAPAAPGGFDKGSTATFEGLSKFEFFAGKALNGLLAGAEPSDEWGGDDIVGICELACDLGEQMVKSTADRMRA